MECCNSNYILEALYAREIPCCNAVMYVFQQAVTHILNLNSKYYVALFTVNFNSNSRYFSL